MAVNSEEDEGITEVKSWVIFHFIDEGNEARKGQDFTHSHLITDPMVFLNRVALLTYVHQDLAIKLAVCSLD